MFLEHKYDKKVVGMFLICLHPDNPYKNYERIEVPLMEKEIKDLYDIRLKEAELVELRDA
jgi:hypothetical protein